MRVLGVGELLFSGSRKGINPSPPIDIARTIEEVLSIAPLDFVHVHEPWAPSAGSRRAAPLAGAQRRLLPRAGRARALDPGRAQVRRAVLRPHGRPHRELRGHRGAAEPLLPRVLRAAAPGRDERGRAPRAAGAPVRIAFSDREERGALRLFLRALRRLPEELPWEAVVYSKTGAVPTLRSSLRHRVHVVDDEEAALAGADIVVAGLAGPGHRARRARAGARAPVRSRWRARVPVYEEILRDGDLGPALRARRRRRAGRAARAARPRRRAARRARPSAARRRAASSPGRASPTRSRRSTRAWPRSATTRTPSPRSARGSRSAS